MALGGASSHALDPLRRVSVEETTKGFPAVETPVPLGEVAGRWRLEDLIPPVLVLRESALAHNLSLMADFCRQHSVELAPHGKTTMAPQLWRRQLEAGAWGISAATVQQARVMLAACVPRILIANEITDRAAIRWVASASSELDVELVCTADSARGVELLAAGLAGTPRPLPILVELGHVGGRTGCRSTDEAVAVGRLVAEAPELTLAGASGYEGTICQERAPECLDAVGGFLSQLRALVERLLDERLIEGKQTLVSAGGSAFFDLVAERLTPWPRGVDVRVLLRSGCYLTHDAGHYERLSPFRREPPARRFRAALEAWGAVVSRPEPELVLLNLGRRDVPFDQDLPTPLTLRSARGGSTDVAGRLTVERLNDQHAFCRVDPSLGVEPGDMVSCGISHPCTAFDKWRVIPVLDDDDRVVDAVATYF